MLIMIEGYAHTHHSLLHMGLHHSLLHMELRSCTMVRVSMLTQSTAENTYNGHVSIMLWSNGRRWHGLINHFLLHHMDDQMHMHHFPGVAPGCSGQW